LSKMERKKGYPEKTDDREGMAKGESWRRGKRGTKELRNGDGGRSWSHKGG